MSNEGEGEPRAYIGEGIDVKSAVELCRFLLSVERESPLELTDLSYDEDSDDEDLEDLWDLVGLMLMIATCQETALDNN